MDYEIYKYIYSFDQLADNIDQLDDGDSFWSSHGEWSEYSKQFWSELENSVHLNCFNDLKDANEADSKLNDYFNGECFFAYIKKLNTNLNSSISDKEKLFLITTFSLIASLYVLRKK